MRLRIFTPPPDENDFIGRKFGKLTVVCKTTERQGGHVIWLCRCVCGKTTRVRTTRLTNDLKRHCYKCFT